MRRSLIVFAVLVSAGSLHAADKDWIGKRVMPRGPDQKIRQKAGNGEREVDIKGIVFTVSQEKDGRLLLKTNAEEGWASKTDWVLLEDAPTHYTARIKANKDDIWALSARGTAWDELGEYDNAIKDYTEVIRLDPTPSDYYNRGMVYRNKRDYDLAIKDLNEAIRLKPDEADYFCERANVYFDKGDFDKAIKDYTEAIRLEPLPVYYRNRGDTYREQREFDKALKDLNEALRREPNSSDFLNIRGLIYQDQKEYDKALTEFTAAIKADPKFVYPYSNRANVYRDQKLYEKAMSDYAEAIRLDPKNDFAYRNRGIAWERQKEWAKALKDYDAAIKAGPKYGDNHNAKAWLLATCPDADHRDGTRAVAAATKACELTEWKNGNYLDTLAAAYAEDGDFEKAVKYQKQAIAADNFDQAELKAAKERLKLYEQKKPYRQ